MMPPSTLYDWPVILRAPGEARNTAIAAMSEGSLTRCSGMIAARRRSMASSVNPSCCARTLRFASESAVRVTPGHIALTLILCRPSCCAAVFVREMTAPLLAA